MNVLMTMSLSLEETLLLVRRAIAQIMKYILDNAWLIVSSLWWSK